MEVTVFWSLYDNTAYLLKTHLLSRFRGKIAKGMFKLATSLMKSIPLWCVHPSEQAVRFEMGLIAGQSTKAPLVRVSESGPGIA